MPTIKEKMSVLDDWEKSEKPIESVHPSWYVYELNSCACMPYSFKYSRETIEKWDQSRVQERWDDFSKARHPCMLCQTSDSVKF